MPRPKKNKEIILQDDNEIINKIVNNVQKVNNNYIVTDKKDNYYLDDFNGVWNANFELIGAYKNNKIYLYDEIKKIIKGILQKNNFIL